MIDKDQLLSVNEAVKMCGLSRTRMYIYLSQGRGPEVVEVAGRKLFPERALAAWNAERISRKKRGGLPCKA